MSDMKPIPGDPDVVAARAATYLGVADAIRTANQTLTRITDLSDVKSEAIDGIREEAGKVADSITKAENRYRGTAEALATYAPLLRQYQSEVETAISDAAEAAESAESQRTKQTEYEEKAQTPGPDQAADQKWAKYYADLADTAEGGASSARTAYDTAYANWKKAADAARSKIDDVVDQSGLNNTLWDKISNVIKTIGEIAAVAAIFLSWVPILGQILVVIAIVGAIAAIIDGAIKFAETGDWRDLAFAVVGAVLTVIAPGIFKVLGKAMKMAAFAKPLAKFPPGAFKSLTGLSKTQFRAANKSTWKDVVLSGFTMKKSHFTIEGFKGAFTKGLTDFRSNPLGLKSPDILAALDKGGDVSKALTVSLNVMEIRGLLGKVETLTNNPLDPNDQKLTLRPDSILKQAANGQAPVLVPGQGAP
ncbi:hypothetical protein [Leifsonia sp. ALI-44-B]|jgi:hypothetical protein|uniref:hypothetical protein n=1 Tax=Leifsonia sp. ALI-44-B TaxID=1933776 RepID=UPI00117AD83E|nr:hypothetical protein [Leifsonia sp. ALI-44-B]